MRLVTGFLTESLRIADRALVPTIRRSLQCRHPALGFLLPPAEGSLAVLGSGIVVRVQ
jgi:hypothetical protein